MFILHHNAPLAQRSERSGGWRLFLKLYLKQVADGLAPDEASVLQGNVEA
jgi:hypothetical protein